MQVEAGEDFGIERIARLGDRAAVIGQRRVDRQTARRRFDDEAIEPSSRNKIEQRRSGDEVERPIKRQFEIAREIDRPGHNVEVGRLAQHRGASKQTEIVIDQPPVLSRRQARL